MESQTIDFKENTWKEILEFAKTNKEFQPNPSWASIVIETKQYASLVEFCQGKFVDLTGTPKQIEWAVKLREDQTKQLVGQLMYAELTFALGSHLEGRNKDYHEMTNEFKMLESGSVLRNATSSLIVNYLKGSNATTFINNRETISISTFIKKAKSL